MTAAKRGNLYLQDPPERLQVAALALNDGAQDVTSDNLGKDRQDIQRACGGS